MNGHDHSYDKYLTENDQFFYDENDGRKGAFLKQDSELYNEEDDFPGKSVHVKRISQPPKEDWQIFVDSEKYLLLRGTRFTAKERAFLRTVEGTLFIIKGAKQGWKSVSEFKRQLKDKA
jgi:hypothetical protein